MMYFNVLISLIYWCGRCSVLLGHKWSEFRVELIISRCMFAVILQQILKQMHSFKSLTEHGSTLLYKVAHLKVSTMAICNSSLWITDAVSRLRRKCHRTEWLWKATVLEVRCPYLKDLQYSFNALVKEAQTTYFSNLIPSLKRNPIILLTQ